MENLIKRSMNDDLLVYGFSGDAELEVLANQYSITEIANNFAYFTRVRNDIENMVHYDCSNILTVAKYYLNPKRAKFNPKYFGKRKPSMFFRVKRQACQTQDDLLEVIVEELQFLSWVVSYKLTNAQREGCLKDVTLELMTSLGVAIQKAIKLTKDEVLSLIKAENTARAKNAAKARHAEDPKQAAKAAVKEHWMEWQKDPVRYKSAAAFASAMMDKFNDPSNVKQTLESQVDKV